MLDIKLIRESPQDVKKNLERRGNKENLKWLDELLKVDKEWRTDLQKLEALKQKRNVITAEVAALKKQGKPAESKIKEVKSLPDQIKKIEEQNEKRKEKIDWYLMRLPNVLHDSVPLGQSDEDNVEVRKWGKAPKFSFEPKNHLEILQGLGLIDEDRAGRVAGAGFAYLKNELVLLDMAIQRFALESLRKKGFMLVNPPYMIRRKPYEGVIDFEDFQMVTYKIENEDWYMIATSEHPMAAMYMGETFDKSCMPFFLAGISPCFRKEVGSHGKYTKGLFRMHQFNKVEQFVFCLPEQSWMIHEEIQNNAEALYQALGLHYRVVNVCTGDIGTIAAKKYDTEFWMADGKFREIGSNSNCTDYQARRLGIKWREKEGAAPAGFVHTLNNTALATSRTMVAIIEQFQQKDGSVLIPKVLWPYMGGIKKLK